MAVKAVIDTNIWVSSLINPFGFPARLRKAFEQGAFNTVISAPIVEELIDVLARPRIRNKYDISEDDVKELIILLEEISEDVLVTGDVTVCRDKDDNLVIETAIKGKAQYLVTRDDDMKFDKDVLSYLKRYNISVASIANFLDVISKS